MSTASSSSVPKLPLPVKCPELITDIKTNLDTDNPERAWQLMEESVLKEPISLLHLDVPIYENKVYYLLTIKISKVIKISF